MITEGLLAIQKFGGRVDHDVAHAGRPQQHRRGKGVVDDMRQAMLPGKCSDARHVSHLEQRVADRLNVKHLPKLVEQQGL